MQIRDSLFNGNNRQAIIDAYEMAMTSEQPHKPSMGKPIKAYQQMQKRVWFGV